MPKKILVVDDEKPISDIIKFNLTKEGFDVDTAYDGEEAVQKVDEYDPDLMILDLMLPKKDGLEVAREVRQTHDMPIIMVTAKDTEIDKVLGLEMGADDYVTKPFKPLELIARVKAHLRRYKMFPIVNENSTTVLCYEKLQLNTDSYECHLDGKKINLTPTEFSILRILLENSGKAVSVEELFQSIWNDESYSRLSSTITVHVRHIREKLHDTGEKPTYIKTVWGIGYKI